MATIRTTHGTFNLHPRYGCFVLKFSNNFLSTFNKTACIKMIFIGSSLTYCKKKRMLLFEIYAISCRRLLSLSTIKAYLNYTLCIIITLSQHNHSKSKHDEHNNYGSDSQEKHLVLVLNPEKNATK